MNEIIVLRVEYVPSGENRKHVSFFEVSVDRVPQDVDLPRFFDQPVWLSKVTISTKEKMDALIRDHVKDLPNTPSQS